VTRRNLGELVVPLAGAAGLAAVLAYHLDTLTRPRRPGNVGA
jgi:hypothetical protein